MIKPHCEQTSQSASILSIGDTTFLDYASIECKRAGYGPIGKGGNGLILHSALALKPDNGQPIGLLWQKLWHREPLVRAPQQETPDQKKQRKSEQQRAAQQRPFEEKESYRWVEALDTVHQGVQGSTRVIHIFEHEGDMTEVFAKVQQLEHTGIVVHFCEVNLRVPKCSAQQAPSGFMLCMPMR
jgi:hypothetical protein